MMTEEKRFYLVCLYEEYGGQKVLTGKAELIDTNGELSGIFENDIYVGDMVDKLNEQDKRIKELEKDVEYWRTNREIFKLVNEKEERIQELEKEVEYWRTKRTKGNTILNR